VRSVASWALFLLVVAATYAVAAPASLGGRASYVIVDGVSMEPTYQHGDLVIAQKQDTYGVDDNIVYKAPIDRQFNVIHRIIATTNDGFVTQGDNRDEPDGWIISHEAIHGAAKFHIPKGGALIVFMRQPAVVAGLLAGLLAFEVLKRREQRQVAPADNASVPNEREAETTR
jgi:signal peptidase I